MSNDRWVVLGLAHPRAGWFRELARWSTTAAIPVDFVKCVSADEVLARLSSGRAFSALLVGGDVTGLDRDLVDTARTAGAGVVVVDPVSARDWAELGVSSVLPAGFDRADLLAVLQEHATPIARVRADVIDHTPDAEPRWRGRLIAVTGAGGAGVSTAAMALSQGLGDDASNHAMVVLADLARHGEQAVLHDTRELVPGLQELVEAHRGGRLPIDEIRSMVFDAEGRGYHLLLGLRRHRDWTALRPRSFDAALDGLMRSYRLVVADVDADVEGEAETGSRDVEDRNLVARSVLQRADLVLAVGTSSVKGLHSLTRTVRDLVAFGTSPQRIVVVTNRTSRNPRRRAEVAASLAALLDRNDGLADIGNPVFLPERRELDDAIRDAVRLPSPLVKPLYDEVQRRLAELPVADSPSASPIEPTLVVPGSLGSWSEEAG